MRHPTINYLLFVHRMRTRRARFTHERRHECLQRLGLLGALVVQLEYIYCPPALLLSRRSPAK